MNTPRFQVQIRRWIGAIISGVLGACFGGSAPAASAAEPEPAKSTSETKPAAEEPGDYRNWFDVSVGGVWIDGDQAQFQKRRGLPKNAFGGIEDFHWEQDVGKRGLFKIDGRGIFDNHDYSIRLEISDPEKGFVRAGYREFRTWYDGSGGFFPQGPQKWFSLYDEEFGLDRGEAFIEAGLRLPDFPQFTVRYTHQFREGLKDSIIWGDSNLTGLTSNPTRAFVPSFWDIDETRDILEADVAHTFGKTDVGLGVRYELGDLDNKRNIRRRPDEPQDRYLTQRDGLDSDLFNAHAFTETRFSEALLFTSGYSFTTMDTDISGSRIYGPGYEAVYDPLFGRRQFRDEGFFNLEGGSQMRQYVLNLNLMYTPWDHLTLVPSVRVEKQELDSISHFLETNVGSAPALASIQEELSAESARDLVDISEGLELRYTGLTNWVLYARAFWMQGEGNQVEREIVMTTGTTDLLRDTDFDRFTQKYAVGANWYPLRRLNMAVQYYHKIRNEDYDHEEDTTPNRSGNRYPAFLLAHDFETDDVNFRITWRPLSNLMLVSRYDFQLSTIDMTGAELSEIQSAESTTHILSQSISWTPWSRLYLQGSINYVMDQTDTPAGSLGPTNRVLNAENDYWTTSAAVGLVLDDKTDLQAQYFYYRADNYVNDSAFTQPYGASAEEHGVTATLIRRLSERVRLTLRYGFFRSLDWTSGGNNNYDAHLVYSSLQYRF